MLNRLRLMFAIGSNAAANISLSRFSMVPPLPLSSPLMR